jgi:LCP family protein required for cell wall assembly
MNLDVRQWSLRRRVVAGLLAVIAVFGLYLGYTGVRAWVAWRSIDRVEFDLAASREALSQITLPVGEVGGSPATGTTAPASDTEYRSFLLIGSDQKPPTSKQVAIYADAILLYLEPSDADPMLISLPRDLLVFDPCTLTEVKLDQLFAGCGDIASGPELLAVVVEDFTGIQVDHFGVIGFQGLVQAIDGLGGIQLCVPHALRQGTRDVLPAGCSIVDGVSALTYVRSRTTQEFVNGEWRFVEGVSDLSRVERQQQVLLALLARAKGLRAPSDLADLISDFGDTILLDDTLSMAGAIDLAWDLRATPPASIRRIVLPVEGVVTTDGQYAVRATQSFSEVIAQP